MNCLRKILSNISAPVRGVRGGGFIDKQLFLSFLFLFVSSVAFSQTTISLTNPLQATTVCQGTVINFTGQSNDPNALWVKWVRVTNGGSPATGPVVATTSDGFGNFSYSFNFSSAAIGGLQTTHVFKFIFGPTDSDVDFETVNSFETSNSITITVNPNPTATLTALSGINSACQNAASPTVNITGVIGTAPFTFTYRITDPLGNVSADQTIQSTGNLAQLTVPTNGTTGAYIYRLVQIQDASSTNCVTASTATLTMTISPLPTATINSSSLTACQSSTVPTVTITATGATAPYTVTYEVLTNGVSGGNQTIVTNGVGIATISPPITTAATLTYQLISVQSSVTNCVNAQNSSVTITVNPKPAFLSISPTTPTICYGANFFNVTLTYSNGPTEYKLDWSASALADGFTNVPYSSNNFTSGLPLTVAVPTATAQVTTYTGTLTVRNGSTGCESDPGTAPFQINALPTPSISASGPLTFCTGNSVDLTGNGGTSYAWSNGSNSQITNITTGGTYSVTVTNAAGCSAATSTTVTVNALPAATITPSGITTFCAGGSVNLTSSAGNSYLWSNASNGATISNITTSGTYTVTVTDGNGCSNTSAPTVVTVNALPAATITPSGLTTFCAGGSVSLTSSAGNSYLWNNASNGTTISNITTSGTYTVTVTDGNGCSNTSAPTIVTVNALPTATITPSGPITFCAGGSVNLTSSAGNSYLWSNASNGAIISNITTSGTYTVTVTDGNGCSNTSAPTVVTVNALPTTTITPSGPTTFCAGGSVSLASSAGNSYLWSNSSNSATISNITTSGTYTVTVTDGNGCSNTSAPTVVTVNTLPTASITPSGPTTFCAGGSVNLTSSAGNSYLWSNSSTGSVVNNITTSGTYTVTVTDGNGCQSTSAPTVVTVNVLPTATITPSGPTTFCSGGSVTLNANTGTGLSYVWTGGGTLSTRTYNAGGSYSVTVTDGNGCQNTSTPTIVTVNALPTATITAAGPTTFCSGGSVTLNANTGTGLSYLWTGGGTLSTRTYNAGGSYSVTVTDGNGCQNTSAPTIVTVNPLPTATINASGPLTFCAGNSVSLTANGGNSYVWSNGSTSANINNIISSGTYTVTVTDGNNCTATSAPVTITVNPLPTINITNPAAVCAPGTVDLTAAAITNGSTAGLSYSYWSNVAGTQTLSTPFAIGIAGTYYIRGTNTVTNCAAIQPVVVTINPQPVIQINTPAAVCAPGTVDITAAAITNGSAAGLSYTYFSDATATITLANANAVNASGIYYIKGTPVSGCSAIVPVSVTINPLPTLVINNPAAVCSPQTINLTDANITAGSSAGLSFAYFSNAALTTPIANAQALNGSGIFYIRATDAITGCFRSGTVTVQVNAAPQGILQTPATNIICENSSLTLSATGGNSYQWLLNQQPITGANTATYNATAAGTYAVRFISAQGCSSTSSNTINLELLNKPTVQFTLTNACAGVSTSFNNTSVTSASGGINWLWDFGDGSSSNQFAPTHIYTSSGTYTVRLTATSPVCAGFNETSVVTYRVQSALSAVRYKDVDVLKDIPATVTARAIGTSYLWLPATGVNNNRIAAPSIRVNTTTEYTVAITNDIGCTTVDTVLLKVIPGVDIYVPQGFTPNNDGQNDRLYPILVGMRQLNYFRVFNRWGSMIFTTKESSAQSGWNGLYLGVKQPIGTYTWMAEAVDLQGNVVRKTGTVLLLQ
jgi:large repetitive protein